MANPILEARGLSKTFRSKRRFFASQGSQVKALNQVSLSLSAGESLGLVGESGSGKTTLARILIGLLEADAGEVLLEGEPVTARGMPLHQRRKLQIIFQNPLNSLNPRMTVGETLREPLAIHKMALAASPDSQIDRLLGQVQLPVSLRKRIPAKLSGGERQRVGIARALALKPEVLICDEPIASLDVSVGVKILELLRSINQQEKAALLFISHDLRAVASLCQQIIVMRQGSIVEQGPTRQIIQAPRHPYTRLLIASASLDLDAIAA